LEEPAFVDPKTFAGAEEPVALGVGFWPKSLVDCGPKAPKRLELVGTGLAEIALVLAPNMLVAPCVALVLFDDVCPEVIPKLNTGFVV
jgi:hypothetical protein